MKVNYVTFYEYNDFKLGSFDGDVYFDGNKDKAEPVQEMTIIENTSQGSSSYSVKKYIYIFRTSYFIKSNYKRRKDGRYIHLYLTIEVDRLGKYSYIYNGQQYSGVDNVPVVTFEGTDNDKIVENYCMLSQIKLEDNRINELKNCLVNDRTLRFRFFNDRSLDYSVYNRSNSSYIIYMTDYLYYAFILHKQYIESLNEFINWSNNEYRTKLAYMSDMIDSLCSQNDKYWDYLEKDSGKFLYRINGKRMTPFSDWRREYRNERFDKTREYEFAGVSCSYWLKECEMRGVFDDYQSSEELKNKLEEEYIKVADRLNESPAGLKYLLERYEDENSWINKDVFNASRYGNQATWQIFALYGTTVINSESDKLYNHQLVLEKMQKYLKNRNKDVWVIENNFVKKRVYGKDIEINFKGLTPRSGKQWSSIADGLESTRIPASLSVFFDIINLAMCVKTLTSFSEYDLDNFMNGVSAAGALIDFLSSTYSLATIGRATLSGTVLTSYIGIISGTITAITCSYDAVKAVSIGAYNRTVGLSVAAVGGVVSAIGAYCLLSASVSAGTVVLSPAAIILGILGAVLTAGGFVISALWGEDDIAIWLKNCVWGKNQNNQSSWFDTRNEWSVVSFEEWYDFRKMPDLDVQITALHNILYSFGVDIDWYYGTLLISVSIPHGLYVGRVILNLWTEEGDRVNKILDDYSVTSYYSHTDYTKDPIKYSLEFRVYNTAYNVDDRNENDYKILVKDWLEKQLPEIRSADNNIFKSCHVGVTLDIAGDETIIVPTGMKRHWINFEERKQFMKIKQVD